MVDFRWKEYMDLRGTKIRLVVSVKNEGVELGTKKLTRSCDIGSEMPRTQ